MSETVVAENSTANRRLFFGGLPSNVSAHQLADAVVEFPKVSIALFKPTGGSRGGTFAFVTFETEEEADRAIESLKDLKIGNRSVSIEKSDPTKRKQKDTSDKSKPSESSESSESSETKASKATKASKNADSGDKDATAAADAPKPNPGRRKLPLSEDSVYIANIPVEVTKEDLAELFESYSDPTITVVTKEPRRRRLGGRVLSLAAKSYAFVKIGAGEQDKAIEELNGKEWRGSQLKVSKATVSPEDVDEQAKE